MSGPELFDRANIEHNDFVVALRNDRGAGGGNLNITCGKDDVPATVERAEVPPGGVGDVPYGGFSNECVVFDAAGGLPTYFLLCGWKESPSAAIRCLSLRGGP